MYNGPSTWYIEFRPLNLSIPFVRDVEATRSLVNLTDPTVTLRCAIAWYMGLTRY